MISQKGIMKRYDSYVDFSMRQLMYKATRFTGEVYEDHKKFVNSLVDEDSDDKMMVISIKDARIVFLSEKKLKENRHLLQKYKLLPVFAFKDRILMKLTPSGINRFLMLYPMAHPQGNNAIVISRSGHTLARFILITPFLLSRLPLQHHFGVGITKETKGKTVKIEQNRVVLIGFDKEKIDLIFDYVIPNEEDEDGIQLMPCFN